MKQKFYLSRFIYFACMSILLFVVALIGPSEAKPANSEKVSCGKVIADGNIQIFETLECGEEEEYTGNDNNSKIYRKDVNLTKQFKRRVKENVYETKAEIKQKFTFEYDKEEKAEICPENISFETPVTNWKVSPLSSISIDDGMCSVSNQYRVYERNFVGNYQYMCDGFADIFCDFNGDIGMNSDIRW